MGTKADFLGTRSSYFMNYTLCSIKYAKINFSFITLFLFSLWTYQIYIFHAFGSYNLINLPSAATNKHKYQSVSCDKTSLSSITLYVKTVTLLYRLCVPDEFI